MLTLLGTTQLHINIHIVKQLLQENKLKLEIIQFVTTQPTFEALSRKVIQILITVLLEGNICSKFIAS
jgi:hypothetical protein